MTTGRGSAMDYPVKARVLARVPKSKDIETHVRLVEVDGLTSVSISDFVVSLGEYGRGYWLPADERVLGLIAQALGQVTSSTKVE